MRTAWTGSKRLTPFRHQLNRGEHIVWTKQLSSSFAHSHKSREAHPILPSQRSEGRRWSAGSGNSVRARWNWRREIWNVNLIEPTNQPVVVVVRVVVFNKVMLWPTWDGVDDGGRVRRTRIGVRRFVRWNRGVKSTGSCWGWIRQNGKAKMRPGKVSNLGYVRDACVGRNGRVCVE